MDAAYREYSGDAPEASRVGELLELAADWTLYLDAEGKIECCRKSRSASGWEPPAQLEGKHVREFFGAGGSYGVDEFLRLAVQQKGERCRGDLGYREGRFFAAGCSRWQGDALAGFTMLLAALPRPSQIDEDKALGKWWSDGVRQELILRNYPGVIWLLDQQGMVTLCEGMMLDQFGITPQELVGKTVDQLRQEYPIELLAPAEPGEHPTTFTIRLYGHPMKCDTNLLYDEEGNLVAQLGVAQDITDLAEMQRKLEGAIEEAERANSAKSDFLSRMSHEIRTPMNAIIGMNSIARKTEDPEKIRYCLDKIESASKQLLSLINDILDMSKIESGKFEIVDNEFDFEKMLQNVSSMLAVRVEEKKQSFTIDFDDVFLSNLICDELRLTQVMLNLLTNAVKFTPEQGSITLKIRHWPVDEERSRLHVEVCDTGIGISPEQQSRLFQSFEQADGTITRKYGGTGLGLVICKKIVELMGGEIWVESEPGAGSRFIFEVNFGWGSEIQWKRSRKDLEGENIRVLTVDDHEDVRIYFGNLLDNFKLRNATAPDTEEALKMIQEAVDQGDPYHLIFLDWQLPGLSGGEAIRAVKKVAGEQAVVIVISVADWADIEQEAVSSGVRRFMPKPVLPSQLFNVILETTEYSLFTREEQAAEEESPYDWRNRRILLAEDIEINREIILSILEETGVEVDCAENGREALELYTADPRRYQIILMDIQMPEMDGLEATRAIRASGLEGCRSIPIVAMTANAFKEDIEQCLAAGMNAHVAKPINLEDLMAKLEAVLGQ